MTDPIQLEARRGHLLAKLRELRKGIGDLSAEYGELRASGILVDTDGIGALITPGYCIAGAREVFEEAVIELDAAVDAVERAGEYTGRLRTVVFD